MYFNGYEFSHTWFPKVKRHPKFTNYAFLHGKRFAIPLTLNKNEVFQESCVKGVISKQKVLRIMVNVATLPRSFLFIYLNM